MIKQIVLFTLLCSCALSAVTNFNVLGDTYVNSYKPCANYGSDYELQTQKSPYATFLKFSSDATMIPTMTQANITLRLIPDISGWVRIYTADDFDENTLVKDDVSTYRSDSEIIDQQYMESSSGVNEIVLDVTTAVAAGHHTFMVQTNYGNHIVRSRESGYGATLSVYR